jgi:crossover junction endodeoxyribonuclease RuvC
MTRGRMVGGLDLSLTSTGIARISRGMAAGDRVDLFTVTSTGHVGDSLTQRRSRQRHLVHEALWPLVGCSIVVVEGPSYASKGGQNWDRAGLWWAAVSALLDRGFDVAIAPPTVVKKFAAGKGTADKPAVAVGMARLWLDVDAENDGQWDALAMATMAAQHLGLDVPSRAHHAGVLAKVAWPDTTKEAA